MIWSSFVSWNGFCSMVMAGMIDELGDNVMSGFG